jgi:hypothetical protein
MQYSAEIVIRGTSRQELVADYEACCNLLEQRRTERNTPATAQSAVRAAGQRARPVTGPRSIRVRRSNPGKKNDPDAGFRDLDPKDRPP